MNKNTQMLLLVGLAGLAGYYFFVKKPADDKKAALAGPVGPGAQTGIAYYPGAATSGAESAARIAEANAAAAKAQAEAAAKIAEIQAGEWWTPIVGGLGEGTGKFLGGLSGLF